MTMALQTEASNEEGRFRRSVGPSQPPNLILHQTGDLRHSVRWKTLDPFPVTLETVGMAVEEGLVMETLRNNDVGHPKGQGPIGSWPRLKMKISQISAVRASGIHHGNASALLPGIQDEAPLMNVGFRRIMAPEKDEFAFPGQRRMVVAVVPIGKASGFQPRRPAEIPMSTGRPAEGSPEGVSHG
jgi:hypothetical protein